MALNVKLGEWAPCRNCKDGQVRGSGLDKYQRRALRRKGEPLPTMHTCETCNGRGYVLAQIADTPTKPPKEDGFGW